MGEKKRKWTNPTSWTVGAVILDDDNKPKGMPVGPQESIWLTAAEERLTAEAPRLAQHNPFVKEWEEPTDYNASGEAIAHTTRKGVLVLSGEPPREIVSDRHIPESPAAEAVAETTEGEPEEDAAGAEREEGDPTEHTGAPPLPAQPPVTGKPAPDEHVATPEAVAANDEYLAKQKRAELEQLAPEDLGGLLATLGKDDPALPIARAILAERQAEIDAGDGERRSSAEEVAESGPSGPEAIGSRKEAPELV